MVGCEGAKPRCGGWGYCRQVLTALVLMAIGAGLLVAGSEAFAEHIVPAARTIGLSAFGLAALVAGAEPEEAWTASVASWRDRPDLAIGDALGANLVIATVTLGLLAVVTTLVITPAVRRYALVAAATAVLALLTVLGGTVTPPRAVASQCRVRTTVQRRVRGVWRNVTVTKLTPVSCLATGAWRRPLAKATMPVGVLRVRATIAANSTSTAATSTWLYLRVS